MVLANSLTLKSFTVNESSSNLFKKFIFLSEIGNLLHLESIKENANITDLIKRVSSRTQMRLNIFKKPASKASLDSPFNFLSE